ncbi:neuronal acetylcholine receptor subunit alpha-4-like [Uranotaenia lowii]|uniref:neuronal acetylcholine receptor subunit alpha-4-like n=1 Tax=Uranotaenia lowii TaxID=190385 RepID=UPI00247AE7B5|nr:neuronal acetylcholine receptor subunit alpha-4-like [Uranotaenia lowii]
MSIVDQRLWKNVFLIVLGLYLICDFHYANGSAEKFNCANGGKDNATDHVLKNALLCGTGYNPQQRPVKSQQDRLAMYIGADIRNVELVHNSQIKLEVAVELSMQWYDVYLHWNKVEHENVHTVKVSTEDIWTPKLTAKSLRKKPVQNTDNHCLKHNCHLSSDGEVIYTMLCTFQLDCLDSSHHWAFDTRACPLRIFTSGYDINKLSLFHFQRRLSYSVAGVLPYKITSFQMAIVNNTVIPEFRMDIVVERMVGPHLVVFLVIIIFLMILNLMITWFRVNTTLRAVLTITSLGVHVVYTVILYWYSINKMEPAFGLANLLMGSLIISIFLATVFTYSERMAKRDSTTTVPRILKTMHHLLNKNPKLKLLTHIGYINLDNVSLESSSEPVAKNTPVNHHHLEADSHSELPIETVESSADSDSEEVDPSNLEWNVFLLPFDRIVFYAMVTIYALMLFIWFI